MKLLTMLCFLDATGEALAGMLRSGSAAASSGADRLGVVDLAIGQLPEPYALGHRAGDAVAMAGHRIVVRADSAGAVKGLIDGLVARNVEFSVYTRVSAASDTAIRAVPEGAWAKAVRADGTLRHAGEVAELDVALPGWPPGARATSALRAPIRSAFTWRRYQVAWVGTRTILP
jgi:hypothetical protein